MHNAASRIAFAAFLHDLGKFAERARLDFDKNTLDIHKQMYCPRVKDEQGQFRYYSHVHAAYTALAWDLIEKNLPDLVRGDMTPFASRDAGEDKTDSLQNAAAMHHRPDTFLQWIIATADRVASGFEREQFEQYNQQDEAPSHYRARLLPLLEQIRLHDDSRAKSLGEIKYCYPLQALSPKSVFPILREEGEPADNKTAQAQYLSLWQAFIKGLEQIPESHHQNWHLWLDHFDTLWQCFTHAIPSATAFGSKAEVSLYDHSKSTAAFATALWLWHDAEGQTDNDAIARLRERSDWETQKILLIQGDFFGIQNFIFAAGSDTNKQAAKLLRGRSFQVSLFAELAALKILRACQLPPTSQILNAAGKFMIVAPNTEAVRKAVETVRGDINQWFLDHCFGQVALGLATQEASCNDFIDKKRFKDLITQSFAVLETAKLQRFNLTGDAQTVLSAEYPFGACPYDHHLPASDTEKDGRKLAKISADQITIGEHLTKKDRLLVSDNAETIFDTSQTQRLLLPIFGFHIAFTGADDITGHFGEAARNGQLLRCWDFSLPNSGEDTLWHGYARRFINAYVPRFGEHVDGEKYAVLPAEERAGNPGDIKTFNHLACEERYRDKDGERYLGKVAIATLKGDVDNLGTIFQRGLAEPTFAKMAGLSRQMNHFFTLWLPARCAEKYPDTYTVFAGGDDFFMIGPWRQIQQLAADMRTHFAAYVARNPDITFSAGIAISKPGLPLPKLSQYGEEALEDAKAYTAGDRKKNALSLYGETVPWESWPDLQESFARIDALRESYGLSSAYLYNMLHFCDLAQKEKTGDIQASMWRSRFFYQTRRFVNSQKLSAKDNAYAQLIEAFQQNGIAKLGSHFRIPLFNHFYLLREK
ncbi:MAG: type III-A CRISPR-associated protein Cas10/Csm1 [Cardiobacteriaceae bacterium]|nr:type III-A CRISPR-associated protein Cas10/Csm1 [Cardiobacteriaceae bacterium]